MPDQEGIELSSIITVIRRWIWLIAGCAGLGVIAAIIFTSIIPPTYEATVTLLVQPAQESSASDYSSLIAGERLALTYSEMLKGELVLDQVVKENNLDISASQLAKRVTAEPVQNTQLVYLKVKDISPSHAAFLANAIADVFTMQVQTIQMERYAGSLTSMQNNMDSLLEQESEIQAQIQNLNTFKIDHEVALSQMESLLVEQQQNYRAFQDEYQSMQLTIATLPERISVSEAAKVSSSTPSTTAVVTLIYSQSNISGEVNYSAETYSKMIVSLPVLETAISRLGLDMTTNYLAARVVASPLVGTQLIELRVVNSDISRAIQLADTIAQVFVDQVRGNQQKPYIDNMNRLQTQIDDLLVQTRETQDNIATITNERLKVVTEISTLENQLAEIRSDFRTLQQDYNQTQLGLANAQDAVVISERATTPEKSTRNRGMFVILAGVVGILLASGIAAFIEYINNVIRTPEDIRRAANATTLGSISFIKEPENELIVVSQPRSPVAEAFRVLATNITMMGMDQPLRSIMITSPHAQEGKSLVVANLAVLFAQREMEVIAIDADLRLPRLHHLYGLDRENGLTDSLLNSKSVDKLKPASVDRLRILTTGDLPPNPADVVASARMRNLISALIEESDLVLIDCPPILPVADASIISSYVDGVILVVRADRTRPQEVRDAIENLNKVGGRLLGVVLNGIPARSDTYSYYYGERLGPRKIDPIMRLKSLKINFPLFGENGATKKEIKVDKSKEK